jgi:hypothetical protein
MGAMRQAGDNTLQVVTGIGIQNHIQLLYHLIQRSQCFIDVVDSGVDAFLQFVGKCQAAFTTQGIAFFYIIASMSQVNGDRRAAQQSAVKGGHGIAGNIDVLGKVNGNYHTGQVFIFFPQVRHFAYL